MNWRFAVSAVVAGMLESVGFVATAARAADYSVNFEQKGENARSWLASQGYSFKIDAGSPAKARFSFNDKGLVVETLARAEPMIAHGNLNIRQPAQLTVTWGVSKYPKGADWNTGVNNEGIMVMVQFGHEQISGGLFVPPSPHFIGFFLCEKEKRGHVFTGRSYSTQGRYVCVDKPPAGTEVTSTINLDEQFRSAFQTKAVPPVTGIAIESDTTQVPSDGRASAWIRSIAIQRR